MKTIIQFLLRLADGWHHARVEVQEVIEPTTQRFPKRRYADDGTLKYFEPGTLTEETVRTTRFYAERRAYHNLEEARRGAWSGL
jgi:hypothetical protein